MLVGIHACMYLNRTKEDSVSLTLHFVQFILLPMNVHTHFICFSYYRSLMLRLPDRQ